MLGRAVYSILLGVWHLARLSPRWRRTVLRLRIWLQFWASGGFDRYLCFWQCWFVCQLLTERNVKNIWKLERYDWVMDCFRNLKIFNDSFFSRVRYELPVYHFYLVFFSSKMVSFFFKICKKQRSWFWLVTWKNHDAGYFSVWCLSSKFLRKGCFYLLKTIKNAKWKFGKTRNQKLKKFRKSKIELPKLFGKFRSKVFQQEPLQTTKIPSVSFPLKIYLIALPQMKLSILS